MNQDNFANESAAEGQKPQSNANTVKLQTPIPRNGGDIVELALRKPGAGELRGLALVELLQMDVNALAKVLPRISQPTVQEREVQQMDPADLVECGGIVVSFLLKQEKTDNAYLTA
ncbi:hypothetical protein CAI21_01465 [Alkalilimnicola ehrlichii]|uniref:Phage tail protein n=1 Tax=Alkalilimnicola ehrlichii TaxID=351052 RepID=A0A3E0X3I4_9GAMM|nr:phage tail assembly protein [Alkalilimnicola ehrlichii]RFA31324.1 hypothetical protein CAI21_01465 [Alkalilimnicola ehrlichii]RFA39402.1 hypothetical protein CAL65_00945 [Alkalilimnicola ehrlichii]